MCFRFESTVPLVRETVFAFHENPQHLKLVYAGWSNIRLLKHVNQVRVGVETWIEITLLGFLPMVLGFRHNLFEPPVRFGERAIQGPFSSFVHLHEFEELHGETLMRDLLEVRLPWHYGGETAVRLIVAPCINRMFDNRARALDRLVREGIMTRCTAHKQFLKGN